MEIMKFLRKTPGGMMIIPFFLAAFINTFIPSVLQIGGMTTALFSAKGVNTLIAATLFFTGTQLRFKAAPKILARSGVLLVAKFLSGFVVGVLVGKFCGPSGFFGISALAIFSAITNSNGGTRLALMGQYGNAEDLAAGVLLGLNDGPFLTMIAIGAAGQTQIPFMSLLSSVIPMIIGCILGNLDEEFAKFCKPGIGISIPLFSFALGATINLKMLVSAGFSGILLGIMTITISGTVCILADKWINRQPGYHGASISTAAGNAVATPAAIALVVPELEPLVAAATAQIATAVVVTAILTPILTTLVAKKYGCPLYDKEKLSEEALAK